MQTRLKTLELKTVESNTLEINTGIRLPSGKQKMFPSVSMATSATQASPASTQARRRTGAAAGMLQQNGLVRLAHDARNVLAALRLYSELLAEPGVLTVEHRHYAAELHAIATASTGLVEQLAAFQAVSEIRSQTGAGPLLESSRNGLSRRRGGKRLQPQPEVLLNSPAWIEDSIEDAADAVRGSANLLAAIAGPQIELDVDCLPVSGSVRLSHEDLTRMLTNLVCNAREAMPRGGRIRITTQQGAGASFLPAVLNGRASKDNLPATVLICVQDNGPGIADGIVERIFDSGFSTRDVGEVARTWPRTHHRGLGLSIVRSLVEAAGGQVRAVSAPGNGARFELEFPLVPQARHLPQAETGKQTFVTGTSEKGQIQC